jgi:3-(3-hydroxy-phenyl)propionate hydroxylase
MTEHAVIIAGGGPTGMMLAGELALAGVDVAIVERRAGPELIGTRAGGLHARTIEVFDQRGIAERFLSQGKTAQVARFHMVQLDISDFPTRHNYGLGLTQNHIERILSEWVGTLPVAFYRGVEVTGFSQDASGVDVMVSDGRSLWAKYLVGCDGGRSLIRKTAGIDFPGWDATTSWLNAEAEYTEEPKWGFHEDALGSHAIGPMEKKGQFRAVLIERQPAPMGKPTLRDVSEALTSIYGTDFGIRNPIWISRFTDMARQAAAYRDRRILLAGDAAHVHPPLGGQGLNIGVQDAVNLGWKLAQVAKGISRDTLLDTYQSERHPVAARVLRTTMAQVAIRRTDERTKALGEIVAELVRMEEPRKRMAGELSGLDIRYDLGEGHPLLGRRMPDLDLVVANGPMRVYSLLHGGRGMLLNLGKPGALWNRRWADRVQLVDARYEGKWELPVVGKVDAPRAVLIRPDGYVAWVGDQMGVGLENAMGAWFGGPAAK